MKKIFKNSEFYVVCLLFIVTWLFGLFGLIVLVFYIIFKGFGFGDKSPKEIWDAEATLGDDNPRPDKDEKRP
jgi:hypothetical protein